MNTRSKGILGAQDGVAVIVTIMVASIISVIGLSLILITEVDTKIALATQINKENLNVGEAALQRALDVLRDKPARGYKEYPWEGALPPSAQVRLNTDVEPDGATIMEGGIIASGSLSSPTYTENGGLSDFDGYYATPHSVTWPTGSVHTTITGYGHLYVLVDNDGNQLMNVPMFVGGGVTGTTDLYAYYTVFVEAVQGDSNWNTPVAGSGAPPSYQVNWALHVPNPGPSPAPLGVDDFDKYQIAVRARVVGLYGSVKDLVMTVKVVKPDGTPYGDEPGSTQGGGSGPPTGGTVTFTQT